MRLHTLLIGLLAGALAGLGVSAIFIPVTILGWLGVLAIGASFGLAGLLVGWLGWRRSCDGVQVAMLGFIMPLGSFLMVIYFAALSWFTRFWGREAWGWLTAVFLWYLLNVLGGWLSTTAVTWRRAKQRVA